MVSVILLKSAPHFQENSLNLVGALFGKSRVQLNNLTKENKPKYHCFLFHPSLNNE